MINVFSKSIVVPVSKLYGFCLVVILF